MIWPFHEEGSPLWVEPWELFPWTLLPLPHWQECCCPQRVALVASKVESRHLGLGEGPRVWLWEGTALL